MEPRNENQLNDKRPQKQYVKNETQDNYRPLKENVKDMVMRAKQTSQEVLGSKLREHKGHLEQFGTLQKSI